ncbi:MAG: nucleotidyltransferase domain-containing protein [Bacteroidetes bacterium]|nr:nucleotidyltransferase domain-containing protein [Bacteroidota bacterium]
MLTREIAIETVKQFVKTCKENNIFFTKVILFGSAATGKTNEYSDIDLLLASDQFGFSKWDNLGLIARINNKYTLIEAHTFPTQYFLEGDPFINEIKRTGIEIN